jgi:hypothetical protein
VQVVDGMPASMRIVVDASTARRWRAPRTQPTEGLTMKLFLFLCGSTLAAAASAADAPAAARPDPAAANAPVPPVQYKSPFAGFRALGDDKPVGWRQANDTVNGIGGWRVYAREARQPDTPPPAAGAKKP